MPKKSVWRALSLMLTVMALVASPRVPWRRTFDKHDFEVLVGDEGDAADGVALKPLADPEATGVSPTAKLTGWQLGELTAT